MKSISDMDLAEVTLAILGAAVNIPDGMYSRAQYLAKQELRAILDNPVVESEFEPDAVCTESDCCPTEGAVLKRFWRENQPDTELCKFYEAEDCQSLVKELVGHVAQLQDAAKRNVKPWEDTFPPTLLPAYIARINAEPPAPVAFVIDIESAAKKLAQCMDYPWEYMPEQGRQSMREHAKAVVEASRLNGVKP